MANVKELLKKQWEEEKDKLIDIDPEKMKEQYRLQVERIGQLEKLISDIERTEVEVEEKAASRYIEEQLERDKIESENKNTKTRNKIELTKVIVPVVGAFVMGLISMKWEKLDTLTSTAGKNSLKDLIRFRI